MLLALTQRWGVTEEHFQGSPQWQVFQLSVTKASKGHQNRTRSVEGCSWEVACVPELALGVGTKVSQRNHLLGLL
jgi:hypothetical protein